VWGGGEILGGGRGGVGWGWSVNVGISCSEFSGGRGAFLLRQLCLRDDCYSFVSALDFVFLTLAISRFSETFLVSSGTKTMCDVL